MKQRIIEAVGSWSNFVLAAIAVATLVGTGIANWVHMDERLADLKQTVVQQGSSTQHQIDIQQSQLSQHGQALANHEGRIENLEKTIPAIVRVDLKGR